VGFFFVHVHQHRELFLWPSLPVDSFMIDCVDVMLGFL